MTLFLIRRNTGAPVKRGAPVLPPQPPVAVNDTAGTVKDAAVTIFPLANDVSESTLSVELPSATSTEGGTLEIVGAFLKGVRYTPPAGFIGEDTFDYIARDLDGLVDTGTVTITVTASDAGNNPPVANDGALTMTQDTSKSVDVLTWASDPDDDPLTVTGTSNILPSGATAVVNPDNTVTYTPPENYVSGQGTSDLISQWIFNEEFNGRPTGIMPRSLQRTVFGDVWSHQSALYADKDRLVEVRGLGGGNRVLRLIGKKDGNTPKGSGAKGGYPHECSAIGLPASLEYAQEFRFRLSPNFTSVVNGGQKMFLGFANEYYVKNSPASAARSGRGGSVLMTMGTNGVPKIYIYHNGNGGSNDATALVTNIGDGNWHTVRMYAKLNTQGQNNGIAKAWVDGVLRHDRTNYRWLINGVAPWFWDSTRLLFRQQSVPDADHWMEVDFWRVWIPTGELPSVDYDATVPTGTPAASFDYTVSNGTDTATGTVTVTVRPQP